MFLTNQLNTIGKRKNGSYISPNITKTSIVYIVYIVLIKYFDVSLITRFTKGCQISGVKCFRHDVWLIVYLLFLARISCRLGQTPCQFCLVLPIYTRSLVLDILFCLFIIHMHIKPKSCSCTLFLILCKCLRCKNH